MNQKIQNLLDGGFISISDVLEYAQQYMDGVDQYDDEQINKYYQEEYNLEWESNDPNAPDYEDTQDVEWPTRSSNPEYIIASILHKAEETYVFEANENGKITSHAEYGGLAKRWGHELWSDYDGAVEKVFGKGKYELLRRVSTDDDEATHVLYKRINIEYNNDDDVVLPQDTWDGGIVQEP